MSAPYPNTKNKRRGRGKHIIGFIFYCIASLYLNIAAFKQDTVNTTEAALSYNPIKEYKSSSIVAAEVSSITQNVSRVVDSDFSVHIGINYNSAIVADIINITHVKKESKIVVHLKKERNCQNPQLIGRLSGQVLSKVDWDKQMYEADDGFVLVGHYDIPLPGRYFVEIIVTMCIEVDYETDVKPICLIDYHHHRLTKENASIDALLDDRPSAATTNKTHRIGHWYNTKVENQHQPLYTRCQPQGCRGEKISDRCMKSVDTSRFDPYEFKFAKALSLKESLENKQGKVCFEGASHAGTMAYFARQILSEFEIENVNIQPHIATFFARSFDHSNIQRIGNNNCSKVVVNTGQWDAGYPGAYPTSFAEYEIDLERTMFLMLEKFRGENVDLYFRATHYIPLGDTVGSCPPTDWRSPPVIDTYNQITKRLCAKYQIPFIDTTDIVGVVWDKSLDWNHYNDTSGKVETMYVLDQIFEESPTIMIPKKIRAVKQRSQNALLQACKNGCVV